MAPDPTPRPDHTPEVFPATVTLPGVQLDRLFRQLRRLNRRLNLLTRDGQAAAAREADRLNSAERRVLAVATVQPQTVKRLANLCVLSTKYTRTAVSSLCRKGHLDRVEHDTYSLSHLAREDFARRSK